MYDEFLWAPEKLGKYKIIRETGRKSSSYAAVFKAIEIHTGEEVAIKILNPYFLDMPSNINLKGYIIRSFFKSANYWKELSEKLPDCIVKILHFDEIESEGYDGKKRAYYYIVMEWMDGALDDVLKMNLSYEEKKEIFLKIVEILARLHSQGKYHGDLRPSNILFIRKAEKINNWLFKLSDLTMSSVEEWDVRAREGVAKEDSTERSNRKFKPLKTFNPQLSDVLTLGKIAYYLFTGHIIEDPKRAIAPSTFDSKVRELDEIILGLLKGAYSNAQEVLVEMSKIFQVKGGELTFDYRVYVEGFEHLESRGCIFIALDSKFLNIMLSPERDTLGIVNRKISLTLNRRGDFVELNRNNILFEFPQQLIFSSSELKNLSLAIIHDGFNVTLVPKEANTWRVMNYDIEYKDAKISRKIGEVTLEYDHRFQLIKILGKIKIETTRYDGYLIISIVRR